MEISITEVKFDGLSVGSGKKVKIIEMVPQPDRIIPERYIPAQIIPEYTDPATGDIIPEQIIPAKTEPEYHIAMDPLPAFTGFKWQYDVQLNLTPCSGPIGNLTPISGEARMVLESMMGFKSTLHYDLELEAGDNGEEPQVVLLGQGVMQWVGQQIAIMRQTWDGKTINIGIS